MLKVKNYKVYILLVLLYFLMIVSSNIFLNIGELIYSFYSEELTHGKIEELLELQKKWSNIIYFTIPLIVFLRSSLVSLSLSVGLFFYDTENKIKIKELFKIALLGEFVLIMVGLAKLLYFLFIKTSYTLQDIQQFYPLSYTNFLDLNAIEPWLIYPLQTINLFEIGYFFVLVYGLHKLLKNKYWKSFEIVAVSYGTGLIIWLGLVMFLTISIT